MWRSKDKYEETRFEAARCPVCKVAFGKRDLDTIFMAHCEECKATFYWRPRTNKPTVELDKHKEKNRCGCGGCGR